MAAAADDGCTWDSDDDRDLLVESIGKMLPGQAVQGEGARGPAEETPPPATKAKSRKRRHSDTSDGCGGTPSDEAEDTPPTSSFLEQVLNESAVADDTPAVPTAFPGDGRVSPECGRAAFYVGAALYKQLVSSGVHPPDADAVVTFLVDGAKEMHVASDRGPFPARYEHERAGPAFACSVCEHFRRVRDMLPGERLEAGDSPVAYVAGDAVAAVDSACATIIDIRKMAGGGKQLCPEEIASSAVSKQFTHFVSLVDERAHDWGARDTARVHRLCDSLRNRYLLVRAAIHGYGVGVQGSAVLATSNMTAAAASGSTDQRTTRKSGAPPSPARPGPSMPPSPPVAAAARHTTIASGDMTIQNVRAVVKRMRLLMLIVVWAVEVLRLCSALQPTWRDVRKHTKPRARQPPGAVPPGGQACRWDVDVGAVVWAKGTGSRAAAADAARACVRAEVAPAPSGWKTTKKVQRKRKVGPGGASTWGRADPSCDRSTFSGVVGSFRLAMNDPEKTRPRSNAKRFKVRTDHVAAFVSALQGCERLGEQELQVARAHVARSPRATVSIVAANIDLAETIVLLLLATSVIRTADASHCYRPIREIMTLANNAVAADCLGGVKRTPAREDLASAFRDEGCGGEDAPL